MGSLPLDYVKDEAPTQHSQGLKMKQTATIGRKSPASTAPGMGDERPHRGFPRVWDPRFERKGIGSISHSFILIPNNKYSF